MLTAACIVTLLFLAAIPGIAACILSSRISAHERGER